MADEYSRNFSKVKQKYSLEDGRNYGKLRRNMPNHMSDAKIMVILILFHTEGLTLLQALLPRIRQLPHAAPVPSHLLLQPLRGAGERDGPLLHRKATPTTAIRSETSAKRRTSWASSAETDDMSARPFSRCSSSTEYNLSYACATIWGTCSCVRRTRFYCARGP